MRTNDNRWYLGDLKDGQHPKRIYLSDFSWDCGWYFGGGYLGNSQLHCHFNGCFLNALDGWHPLGSFINKNAPLPTKHHTEEYVIRVDGHPSHLPLSTWLDNPQYDENTWWRIKDLFVQFYAYKKAAEAFHSGGHMTSRGRNEAEINPDMEEMLNKHIEEVVIAEIRDVLDHQSVRWYEYKRKFLIQDVLDALSQ